MSVSISRADSRPALDGLDYINKHPAHVFEAYLYMMAWCRRQTNSIHRDTLHNFRRVPPDSHNHQILALFDWAFADQLRLPVLQKFGNIITTSHYLPHHMYILKNPASIHDVTQKMMKLLSAEDKVSLDQELDLSKNLADRCYRLILWSEDTLEREAIMTRVAKQ